MDKIDVNKTITSPSDNIGDQQIKQKTIWEKISTYVSENIGRLKAPTVIVAAIGLIYKFSDPEEFKAYAVSTGKIALLLFLMGLAVQRSGMFTLNVKQNDPRGANLDLEAFTEKLVDKERKSPSKHEVSDRDKEIKNLLKTLIKKEKSSAIILGPAGCGKTAIVEGLAQMLAKGDPTIPLALQGYEILKLDMLSFKATTYTGQQEERLGKIIEYLKNNPKTILFVDEAHMLMDRGGLGQTTVANELKEYLARGLKMIGATTKIEYDAYLAPDPAFCRRFVPIHCSPMKPEATQKMLVAVKNQRFEKEYEVTLSDNLIEAAIALSKDIPNRVLPDIAIDLLGQACSSAQYAQCTVVTDKHIKEAHDMLVPANDVSPYGPGGTFSYYS